MWSQDPDPVETTLERFLEFGKTKRRMEKGLNVEEAEYFMSAEILCRVYKRVGSRAKQVEARNSKGLSVKIEIQMVCTSQGTKMEY